MNGATTKGKLEIIEVAQYLFNCGFHAARAGNISLRMASDRVVCTCSGADKSRIDIDDLITCDLNGKVADGSKPPTSELAMHLVCYRERRDVGAVIHAHPPIATAFAAASTALDELALPEMVVLLGSVALVPYATPGTTNLADQLRSYLPQHDAFLLENHGALSVGRDLWDAAQKMELIEQNARISLALRQIGQPFQLSEGQRQELMSIRAQRNAAFRHHEARSADQQESTALQLTKSIATRTDGAEKI